MAVPAVLCAGGKRKTPRVEGRGVGLHFLGVSLNFAPASTHVRNYLFSMRPNIVHSLSFVKPLAKFFSLSFINGTCSAFLIWNRSKFHYSTKIIAKTIDLIGMIAVHLYHNNKHLTTQNNVQTHYR